MNLSDSMDLILQCVEDVESGVYTTWSDMTFEQVEEGYADAVITMDDVCADYIASTTTEEETTTTESTDEAEETSTEDATEEDPT